MIPISCSRNPKINICREMSRNASSETGVRPGHSVRWKDAPAAWEQSVSSLEISLVSRMTATLM
jgi:hypothetical protein